MGDARSDELLHEIFLRLPPPSNHVSLVSKRWLSVHRHSLTSLSIRLYPRPHRPLPSFSSLLSNLPCLSSLTVSLFLAVADLCPNLRSLSFLPPFPVSDPSLALLSRNCPHRSSLSITLSRPLGFRWLLHFSSLRELSFLARDDPCFDFDDEKGKVPIAVMEMRGTSTGMFTNCGSRASSSQRSKGNDSGVCWLSRRCCKVRRLSLKSCERIGIDANREDRYFWLIRCLNGINEVEIRICWSIVDEIQAKLAEHCNKLVFLLLHDGGSRKTLL